MSISLSSLVAEVREYIHRAAHRQSDAGLECEFNRLALDLFAFQFEAVPVYRRWCEERNALPETLSCWNEIPALPAATFKSYEVTSLNEAERTRFFLSSGTTEQIRGRHFHDEESMALYEASLLPWFKHNFTPGIAPEDFNLMILTPGPEQAPHSSLVHMFETVRRDWCADSSMFFGCVDQNGAWHLDTPRAKGELRRAAEANRPVALLGTAFGFVHLVDAICEFRLPRSSRVLETGGYKGRSRVLPKADLHTLISQKLGIHTSHIVSEYGMSELSSQAYDRVIAAADLTAPRVFRFPPWARAQIISPENGTEAPEGQTGLIRIFDLANVRSVMAVQTEDLGIRRSNGFELLGRDVTAEPRGCSLMAV